MTRNAETVTVLANGVPSRVWKHVHVNAGMNRAARYFGLETVEKKDPNQIPFSGSERAQLTDSFAFPPGTEIEIYATPGGPNTFGDFGDLLTTGYVNAYSPTGDPRSHSITIEGRSATQDWVDGAAIHDRGEWMNQTPLQIAQDLNAQGYDIKISSEIELEEVEYFHIYQGETVDQALERLTRDQFVTRFGQADGSLVLTNASVAKRHTGGLIEGFNVGKFSGRLSDAGRHSEVIVKGQRNKGTAEVDLRVRQSFKDRGVRRFRPKIIIHEGNTTPTRAQKRAQQEVERALGFSVRAVIITQGWRDDGGKLWTPNHLVYVESPSLKIAGDMLIESVDWHQVADGQTRGSQSEISLVHPAAYKGSAGKATKTDQQWGYM